MTRGPMYAVLATSPLGRPITMRTTDREQAHRWADRFGVEVIDATVRGRW